MKLFRYIIFVSILGSAFILMYRQSNEKGVRRWFRSFKMAVLLAGIAAGLIPSRMEASEHWVPNNKPPIEWNVAHLRGGFKPDPNHRSSESERQADDNSFKVTSKIEESKRLSQISAKIRKDKEVAKGLDKLKTQLESGEFHAGRGAKKLSGTKTVYYMRSSAEPRLFFSYSPTEKGSVEILTESNKDEETKVITNLKRNYE